MRTLVVTLLTAALAGCSSTPPKAEAPAPTGLISETSKSPEALEHFHQGQTLFYNLRTADAAAEFEQALGLDPGFVLARAYHAQSTPGDKGIRETEDAAKAADSLPEAERLFVQAIATGNRGDVADAEKMLRRVVEVAPNDWRSHFALGFHHVSAQKYSDAIPALQQATRLNAGAAFAQNMLGYALLRQGDSAGAIKAFEEYVRMLPQEPNPQDSLGEALMAAGKFQEADAAFNRALMLSPQFWNAFEGLAYTKIYAGDSVGGRKAFDQAKMGAPTSLNKLAVSVELAAAAAAEGRTGEALQLLDAARQTADAAPSDLALLAVRRAQVLIIADQPGEAIAALMPAFAVADAAETPVALARPLRTEALRARITAEGRLNRTEAAAATAALLRKAAADRADDPAARTAASYADGIVAMVKRDFASARTSFDACAAEDDWCQWQAIVAAQRAGDKASAATGRDRLLRLYRRDPIYLMIRSQVMRAASRSTE